MPLRDRFTDGGSLGADTKSIGSVLDIAAGENRSVPGLHSRTDGELGVGRVGVSGGSAGGLFEIGAHSSVTITTSMNEVNGQTRHET